MKFELSEIFNHLDLCVVILDSDMKVQYCNSSLLQVLGLNHEYTIRGEKWTKYIANGSKSFIKHIYDEILNGNASNFQYQETSYAIQNKEDKVNLKWFNSKVNGGHNMILSIGIPIPSDIIDSNSSIQKIRNYYKELINQDRTRIQVLKGTTGIQINE